MLQTVKKIYGLSSKELYQESEYVIDRVFDEVHYRNQTEEKTYTIENPTYIDEELFIDRVPMRVKRSKLTDVTRERYHMILGAFNMVDWVQLSVRGVYYRCVGLYDLPKDENTYSKIQDALKTMRKSGLLDAGLVIDGTRTLYGLTREEAMKDHLRNRVQGYSKDLWSESRFNVMVMVEKDAMRDILYKVCSKWYLDIMSTRGFNSLTSWFNLAKQFEGNGKMNIILMFTDYDSSGLDMVRNANEIMSTLFDVDVQIVHCGVTKHQIEAYNLPTRPDKKKDNKLSYAVELDAFMPKDIQEILEVQIQKYMTPEELEENTRIEQEEINTYYNLLGHLGEVDGIDGIEEKLEEFVEEILEDEPDPDPEPTYQPEEDIFPPLTDEELEEIDQEILDVVRDYYTEDELRLVLKYGFLHSVDISIGKENLIELYERLEDEAGLTAQEIDTIGGY